MTETPTFINLEHNENFDNSYENPESFSVTENEHDFSKLISSNRENSSKLPECSEPSENLTPQKEISRVSENIPETISHPKSSLAVENDAITDDWMDITGTGNFKKKVLKKGLGPDTRPMKGDLVTTSISFYVNGSLFEEHHDLKFVIGDLDVISGLDLAVSLMEKEEKAKIKIPSKLAYGKVGRLPDVPPETDIECEVELKDVEALELGTLSATDRLKFGNQKRTRGNFFYERGEYVEAIHCYEKATEYLDGVYDGSDAPTSELQEIVDMRIKVYNNMAASHLKLNAFSSALKSVDLVLKIQPKNVKALFRKAKILGTQGSTDEAIAILKVAASLEPETKVIQNELIRLQTRRKREFESQKAMYQKMFPKSPPKEKTLFSKVFKWTMVTTGVVAVGLAMAAYKHMHS